MKKIEDVLFYTATRVQPPKGSLEQILEDLPVTNPNKSRYIYVMNSRFFLPVGILAFILLLFFTAKKPQTQTVVELPASITKQNVNDSMNKIDASIQGSMDEMDKDLNEADQESSINEDSNGDINQILNE